MTIQELNQAIRTNCIEQIVLREEDRHRSAYAIVASKIASRGARVALMSGPSSSGKTTSSKRIGRELERIGLHSMEISLDNYFVERLKTPLDEFGNYDFESIDALDLDRFGCEIMMLLRGEEVFLQKFDFRTGQPVLSEQSVRIDDKTVLIVEGLHALNPALTSRLSDFIQYRIYLSALSPLQLNPLCEIRPRDNILMRRMIRDFQYRARSARATLESWPQVRRGEQVHILPFEDEADVVLDTSLGYEVAVLKPYVISLLIEARDMPDAQRLLHTLECIEPMSGELVPCDSVLREYIGGSCFQY